MSLSGKARERLLTVATVAATAAAVVAAVPKAVAVWSGRAGSEEVESRTIADWERFASRGGRIGPPAVSVTIVEFSDFACPACRVASVRFREILRRHPGKVGLVYRHFPLGVRSREAAAAAECARRDGAFERMHDVLFAKADSFGVKPWTEFARAAGMTDLGRFATCMMDTTVIASVWADVRAADSLFIGQTPSFLVNDRLFTGAPDLDGLNAYVARLVARTN